MTTATPPCTAYIGSLEDIPSTATPGLLFLKAYLPIRDSVVTSNHDQFKKFHAPSAVSINNAAPPVFAPTAKEPNALPEQVATKLTKRNAAVQRIDREFRRAWDIDNGNGKRTVIYESRNFFVFKKDPENPLLMPEAGMIELERVPKASDGDGEGEEEVGISGYWATELRSWHDRVGMLKKREELGC